MEDSQVIVQTTCSVSLSTEGSIIPFTPGDVYLCASDNSDVTDLWCLVVLHKRNFPRKYSIIRQLTKITVRKRGSKIGFIVIEFDDTNQVRLKDFPSDPTYIARVLEFCYDNKDDPKLVEKLKDEKLKEKLTEANHYNGISSDRPIVIDISPDSSSRGSFIEPFDERSCSSLESAEFVDIRKTRRAFTTGKRSLDTGCITPPVRCIASIEETRVINEADVEDIPEKEQVAHNNTKTTVTARAASSQGAAKAKQKISLNRGYHSVGSSPVSPTLTNGDFFQNGDVLSTASSHGSTPPREFVVSVFDQSCGADVTVSSHTPEKDLGKKKVPDKVDSFADYPKYSTFNFPASSPSPPLSNFPDVNRRSKRRLTSSARFPQEVGGMVTHEPAAKERRRILSDGPPPPNMPCKRGSFSAINSKRSRLRTTPSIAGDTKFSNYIQRMQHTQYNGQGTEKYEPTRSKSYEFLRTIYPSNNSNRVEILDYAKTLTNNRAPRTDHDVEVSDDLPHDNLAQNNHRVQQQHCIDVSCNSDILPATIIESFEPDPTDQIQTEYLDHLNLNPDYLKEGPVENGNHLSHSDPEYSISNASEMPEEFFQKVLHEENPPSAVDSESNANREESEPAEKRTLRPRTEPASEASAEPARPRKRTEAPVQIPPERKPQQRRKSESDIIGPGVPKPHGFVNLGNTCYMNCVLQCVLTVPSFKSLLRSPANPFTPSLFNCLAALMHYKTNSGGTKEKKDMLVKVKTFISDATSLFKGSRQQDAHEFLGKFLDVLREERKYSLKCPVSRTFHCEVIHTLRCVSCRAGGQKTEKYYDFSLNLPGRNLQPHNLAELLDSYFATDVVELKCSACGHDTAQVQHRFSQLPQALVLHIQRYAFSRSGSREGKRQDSVFIPSRLDITKLGKDCIKDNTDSRVAIPDSNTPLIGHNLRARTKGLYSLHAVISHLGESRECGHYICDVRESGQWYFYDDVNMHLVDLPYVRSKRKNSCYLFFYLRDDTLLER